MHAPRDRFVRRRSFLQLLPIIVTVIVARSFAALIALAASGLCRPRSLAWRFQAAMEGSDGMSVTVVLRTEDVYLGRASRHILRGVSFSASPGELVGPSTTSKRTSRAALWSKGTRWACCFDFIACSRILRLEEGVVRD
jgi:hypothetical protein